MEKLEGVFHPQKGLGRGKKTQAHFFPPRKTVTVLLFGIWEGRTGRGWRATLNPCRQHRCTHHKTPKEEKFSFTENNVTVRGGAGAQHVLGYDFTAPWATIPTASHLRSLPTQAPYRGQALNATVGGAVFPHSATGLYSCFLMACEFLLSLPFLSDPLRVTL